MQRIKRFLKALILYFRQSRFLDLKRRLIQFIAIGNWIQLLLAGVRFMPNMKVQQRVLGRKILPNAIKVR